MQFSCVSVLSSLFHFHHYRNGAARTSDVKNSLELGTLCDARPVKHTEGVAAAVSDTTDELQDFLAEEESSQMAQLSDEKRKEYPKTRHEFFKYSCKTTLDPSTAHEYIQLEGKFKAKNSFVRKLPHPDRFTDWPQVLCRENMTGRHYWEVEWKGPEVFIVVSSKSISRSGAESAFGNNNISWALQCFCDGYEFRCNNYRTYIPGPPSSRIGVYLDLDLQKRGLHSILSFYSITDTMTLIHRVQDTFNWQLYRQPSTLTFTPTDNLQSPINPERTHAARGEHGDSTQKDPGCPHRDANRRPSSCEATVLTTEPPCSPPLPFAFMRNRNQLWVV
uniref:B30.2/SPRY domain-containing protein n=1 Tax=Stegastes partitus TaxID=144197 RepID=A0A3B5ADQ6_9TELE